ncbi:MAG: glutathione S-transferase family protein [Alphaproteobacteria bacterium]|nr:glutathione S-transferase family protein [Alphaproteobacteria bacterium]
MVEQAHKTGFTLYGSPNSQFTYKVALMLALSGEQFSFRFVSFREKVHLTDWFQELSRWGQVPVLEHDGRVLVQSPAILEYLSENLGRFAADTPDGRLTVREWLYWNTDRLAWPINASWGIYLGEQKYLPISVEPEIAAYIRSRTERMLTQFETYIPDTDFLVGSSPTIADVCCYGDIPYARICNYAIESWPKVCAWAQRVEALPRFKGPFELLELANAEVMPEDKA